MDVARDIGCAPSQVAARWAMDRRGVVIPLIGPRNLAHLEDDLGALEVRLSPGRTARPDAAAAIELGVPADAWSAPNVRRPIRGGTLDAIDDHRGWPLG